MDGSGQSGRAEWVWRLKWVWRLNKTHLHTLQRQTKTHARTHARTHLAVKAVRHPPVAGDGVPKVLHAEGALEAAGAEPACGAGEGTRGGVRARCLPLLLLRASPCESRSTHRSVPSPCMRHTVRWARRHMSTQARARAQSTHAHVRMCMHACTPAPHHLPKGAMTDAKSASTIACSCTGMASMLAPFIQSVHWGGSCCCCSCTTSTCGRGRVGPCAEVLWLCLFPVALGRVSSGRVCVCVCMCVCACACE